MRRGRWKWYRLFGPTKIKCLIFIFWCARRSTGSPTFWGPPRSGRMWRFSHRCRINNTIFGSRMSGWSPPTGSCWWNNILFQIYDWDGLQVLHRAFPTSTLSTYTLRLRFLWFLLYLFNRLFFFHRRN